MKRLILLFCLFSVGLTAQNPHPDALQIGLNKNKIKLDRYVDFVDGSKKISLAEDGMFIYSSLDNNGDEQMGYASNEDYVVTLTNPSQQKIRIRTDYIALTADGDVLRFFDGPDTLHPLMASYTGFLFNNELIVSHGSSITIAFKSNSTGVSRGFRLRADQANLKGYNLSSVQSCLNSTPAADACVNAPLICNLNGYCGNTSGQYTADNTNIPGFCGSIENNSWLSFIASSASAQFEFISAGCQSTSSGIQALIYASSNCSNFTQVSNCVSQGSSSGSFTITTNTPLVIGTKYYIMVDGYGGNVCNYSVTAQSGVATNPQITANPTQICPGSSTQLGSSIVSTSYSWTASDGTPLPNTQTITVTPAVTTTYTLEVGPSGCSPAGGTAVQTITVTNVLPPPSISAPSGGCAGNSVTFSSLTNGGTYSWSGPNGFTSNLQNPTINNFTNSNAGTYTLEIFYGPGCATLPATVNLSVLPSPTVNVSVSPSSAVCAGNPVILTASGGTGANPYSWNWNSAQASGTVQACVANPLWVPGFEFIFGPQFFCTDNPFPGANAGATATVIPNQNTQVCVSTTGSNGCIATACQNLYVLSNTALTTSPSVTTCPTQSVMLSGFGASSYTWTPAATLNSANGSTVSANPMVTTIYTVTGEGCGGTILSNTVEVSVNSTPPVIGAIQSPTMVCPNQTDVHFTVNSLAGTAYNWTLTPGAVITSTNPASHDVTANLGSATGTFTVAVTATNSCGSTTETVTIDVTQIIVTATASPAAYCAPGSSTISVSGAYWYDIQPTNGLATSSGTMTTFVASPTVTTSYTITGNQGACLNSTVVTISVGNGGSVLNVSSSGAGICPTGSVILTASGAGSYTWSPSPDIIGSLNNSSVTVNPSVTTTYSVSGEGCSGVISNTIEVVVVNSISISSSATQTLLCPGHTSTLTASGANSYTWSPGTGLSSTNGSVTVASPLTFQSYTVTGLTGTCTHTSVLNINVSESPSYTVTANPLSICAGQSAVLTATANGVSSYTWNTGATQYSLTVNPSFTTTYTVTGNSNCPGQGVVTVTVNQLPIINLNAGTICANETFTLSATGANSYTWSTGANQNSATVSPTSTTVYSVTGVNTAGCVNSQSTTITVNKPVASFSGMSNATEIVGTTLSLQNTSSGAGSIAWETCFGSVSSSSVISLPLPELGSCCVKLYAFEGLCIDSIEKCVTVVPLARLIIPNVFTPNGDGNNDVFTLDAIGIGDIAISIFDRWGLKMFETTGSGNIIWDGKNKGGSFVTDGTYFFMLKATGLDGEVYDKTGTINVFR
jgi:gliding motility-associated-like protein